MGQHPDLTIAERLAIASFKRLAKRWPKSLWLFAGSGGVHILRAAEDGSHVHVGEGIDQDFVVDHVDIPADGGDW